MNKFKIFLAVQVAMFNTSTTYSYTSAWYHAGSKKKYVTFKVQACHDAHVALFDQFMLDIAYEIVIGGSGNSLSAIRRTRLLDNKVQVKSDSKATLNSLTGQSRRLVCFRFSVYNLFHIFLYRSYLFAAVTWVKYELW